MAYTYAFEKLNVWKNARMMVKTIYQLTSVFPIVEKYGLTAQMRRASISVVSNIAEGSGRKSLKDQSHFYHMAYSSCIELLNQAIISNDLDYLNIADLDSFRSEVETVSNKLNALRNSCSRESPG